MTIILNKIKSIKNLITKLMKNIYPDSSIIKTT